MWSSFPCEIDDTIQYINLGYGAVSHIFLKIWNEKFLPWPGLEPRKLFYHNNTIILKKKNK